MSPIRRGILNPTIKLVSDAAYLSEVRSLVANSRERCLCSLFIVDVLPARDEDLLVDGLLQELQAARWRGVDARLLIGGSRTNLEIAQLSDFSRARAHQLQISCRWLTSKAGRGSHMKLVIADGQVLTGSHNWSAGALTEQIQDSVLVTSLDLAAYLQGVFENQWKRADSGGTGVQV
jgi:phosphatidylserine/phosphatidylglycerophosphate/cardiolipin synthase-like enzyme